MRWSLTLGSIGGTAIRIHVTFLLFLIWLGAIYYRQGGAEAAWQGTIFVVLIFLCVLLHELGHVFAARRYGVNTRDVTLWPFGGIASMEQMPEKPAQELVVALAGPAVNVVIATVLLVWLGSRLDPENLTKIDDPAVSMAAKVAGANIILVLFNMIPAFPMDGGRVLRALLAIWMGNARATEVAAAIGQGFAVVFGIVGIFYNPMLLIIAVFIFGVRRSRSSPASRRGARFARLRCHDHEVCVAGHLGDRWRRRRRADPHDPDGVSHRRWVRASARRAHSRRHNQGAEGARPRHAGARSDAGRHSYRAGARQARYSPTISDGEGTPGGRGHRGGRPSCRPAHGRESRRDDDGSSRPA